VAMPAHLDLGQVLTAVGLTGYYPIVHPSPPVTLFPYTTLFRSPSFSITKTADQTEFDTLGDKITYTITVSNTGNVTLQDLEVTDVLFPTWSETVATLAPDSAKVYTLEYEVTQADLDSGKVVNAVALTGDDPNGDPLTPGEDDVEVPAVQSPAITVTKTTDRTKTYSQAGDVIEYTIVVTNTGNVTLTDVEVTDDNADVTSVGTVATLEVGQSETFTASHTVTQADLDAGVVYNIATAAGKDRSEE